LEKLITDEIKDNVLLLTDFDALEPKGRIWMSAADLLVYLHGDDYPSEDSSLGICDAIAYRKPVLISEAAKFRRMAAILKESDLESFVIPVSQTAETLLRERILSGIARVQEGFSNEKLVQAYTLFAQENSWTRIAEKMHDVYKEIMENGRN
jgi:hypothetical protein